MLDLVSVMQYVEYLLDIRPLLGVRTQQESDKVLEFAGVLFTKPVLGIDDCQPGLVLKGVFAVGHRVQDAAKHPDIYFARNLLSGIDVSELRRSVHHRGAPLDLFLD